MEKGMEREWEKEEVEGALQPRQRQRKEATDNNGGVAEEEKVEGGDRKGGERSVYLDQDQGVWKCHHCTWTYQLNGPGIDHFQSHEDNCHLVRDVKILHQHGSNFDSQTQGIKISDDCCGIKFKLDQFVPGTNMVNGEAGVAIEDLNSQEDLRIEGREHNSKTTNVEIGSKYIDKKSKSINGANSLVLSEECSGNGITRVQSENGASEQVILVNKSKLEIAEFDVERVLEEQDTHDLYCPKCHLCITKRVILRKRKKIIKDIQYDAKRGKFQEIQPILDATFSLPETTDQDHEREPDVFRCLSCFSFFIPTDKRFNIFRVFRKREMSLNQQSSQQLPASSISMNSENKGAETGISLNGESSTSVAEHTNSSNKDVQYTVNTFISENIVPGECQAKSTGEPKDVANNYFIEISLNGESSMTVAEYTNSSNKDVQNTLNTFISESIVPSECQAKSTGEPKDVANNNFIGGDIRPVGEGMVGSITDQKVIPQIPVSVAPTSAVSQHSETRISVDESITGEERTHEWDVLKSIVYGGLMESITSLGIISSAAAADATTLNIVALGLANLIGGLFVIAHNLSELRSAQQEVPDHEGEPVSRYWELLGRRANFRLHATVAIISYIIFGLLPPIIYGFSFQKSNNKEYKLITVAAASLLCIAFLAIGKAHVKPQRAYFKMLSYYIGFGVTASGLSYVAGVVVNRLLEKLGLFNQNAEDAPLQPSIELLGMSSMVPTWVSY